MNIILYNIAKYSHYILIVISLFLLRNNNTLLYYYIIGVSLSELINMLLKILIKEDRPKNDKSNDDKSNDDKSNDEKSIDGKSNDDKDELLSSNIQKYGMPSGHAQSVSFSTMFIYLSLHNIYLTSIFIIISFIAVFQRVYLKFHTLKQVIVGILVGSFLSYLFYKLAVKNYFPIIYKYKFLLLLFPFSFIHVF